MEEQKISIRFIFEETRYLLVEMADVYRRKELSFDFMARKFRHLNGRFESIEEHIDESMDIKESCQLFLLGYDLNEKTFEFLNLQATTNYVCEEDQREMWLDYHRFYRTFDKILSK